MHGKPNIKLSDFVDRKTIRFMGSGSAYNYIAMKEAITDSGLEESEVSNFLRLELLWVQVDHLLKM